MRDAAADHVLFQSTLSVRRATRQGRINVKEIQISIHALRKESDKPSVDNVLCFHISIHALRKESDLFPRRSICDCRISIHALRKESDHTRV